MKNQDFTTTFLVENPPNEVFKAINNVRGWWPGQFEGNSEMLGSLFIYNVPDIHYTKLQVTEFIPGKMLNWHVEDAILSYLPNKKEWKGTDIIFEINPNGDRTELRFTHKGLGPTCDCYKDCSSGWNTFINRNLYKLIITGKDQAGR